MAKKYSGTFSGTGNSDIISGSRALIVLDFDGTATINVQVQRDETNWVTAESYTATGVYVWGVEGINAPIRLNCSAHTDDVDWTVYT